MNQKTLIYVAGNPDGYPLEYFDRDTQTFEGVIPQLLREFSEQSGYDIVYYGTDGDDHRADYAVNNQVDLLSGYAQGDRIPENDGSVVLFTASMGGEEQVYYLYFTDATPDTFRAELTGFLSSLPAGKITGALLSAGDAPNNEHSLHLVIVSLALVVVLLGCTIALLVRAFRKRLRNLWLEAHTDEVTGLGNGEQFQRYYRQYVNDKNKVLYQLLYFYVDTDHLRRIIGGKETDEFVSKCASVLRENAADTDILARVSERGFAMLRFTSGTLGTEEWLKPVLERVRQYAEQCWKLLEVDIYVGVYPLKKQDWDLNEMLFYALQGAYEAQRTAKDYVLCSNEMMERIQQEKLLQASIDDAFSKHEFQLYLQFYVDAHTFDVVGGEALSRWNHPQRGVLLSGEFVPLMEREKSISRLDYYCLEEVCGFLEELLHENVDTFFISCNFSRETFVAPEFVKNVKNIINRYTFPRELLIMEITESVDVENVLQIQKNVTLLQEYGVQVILDDFGEGFTSFYDLQKYSINGIKLGKSLIDHMMTPSGMSVLKGMIQVGHELNMTILAEGVEEDSQVEALQKINCDVIQGFRFYHPMPRWEVKRKILSQHEAAGASASGNT